MTPVIRVIRVVTDDNGTPTHGLLGVFDALTMIEYERIATPLTLEQIAPILEDDENGRDYTLVASVMNDTVFTLESNVPTDSWRIWNTQLWAENMGVQLALILEPLFRATDLIIVIQDEDWSCSPTGTIEQ